MAPAGHRLPHDRDADADRDVHARPRNELHRCRPRAQYPLLCGAASVLRDARPRGSGDKLGLLLKRDPGSYLPHELVQHLPKTVSVDAPGTTGMVFDVLAVDNGQNTVNVGTAQTQIWTACEAGNGDTCATAPTATRTLTATTSCAVTNGAACSTAVGSASAVTMSENWTNQTGHDGAYYLAGIPMLAGSPTLVRSARSPRPRTRRERSFSSPPAMRYRALGSNLYRSRMGSASS